MDAQPFRDASVVGALGGGLGTDTLQRLWVGLRGKLGRAHLGLSERVQQICDGARQQMSAKVHFWGGAPVRIEVLALRRSSARQEMSGILHFCDVRTGFLMGIGAFWAQTY